MFDSSSEREPWNCARQEKNFRAKHEHAQRSDEGSPKNNGTNLGLVTLVRKHDKDKQGIFHTISRVNTHIPEKITENSNISILHYEQLYDRCGVATRTLEFKHESRCDAKLNSRVAKLRNMKADLALVRLSRQLGSRRLALPDFKKRQSHRNNHLAWTFKE